MPSISSFPIPIMSYSGFIKSGALDGVTWHNAHNIDDQWIDWNEEFLRSRPLSITRSKMAWLNNPIAGGLQEDRIGRALGAFIDFRPSINIKALEGVDLTSDMLAEIQNRLRILWDKWCSFECDFSGTRHMGTLQREMMRERDLSGAVLVHVVKGPKNQSVPISIELIQSSRMGIPTNLPANQKHRINQAGVVFNDDSHSKPIGYWVKTIKKSGDDGQAVWKMLSTDEAYLFDTEKLVGVKVGLPRDSRVISSLINMDKFQKKMLAAATVQVERTILVTPPEGFSPDEYATFTAQNLEKAERHPYGTILGGVSPDGVSIRIAANGEKMQYSSPNVLNPDAKSFTGTQLHSVAAGAGVAYSRLMKEPDGNFSSAKQMENLDWPAIENDHFIFKNGPGRFIWSWFVQAAWAAGLVDMPEFLDNKLSYCRYSTGSPPRPALDEAKRSGAKINQRKLGAYDDDEMADELGITATDLYRRRAVLWKLQQEIADEEDVGVDVIRGPSNLIAESEVGDVQEEEDVEAPVEDGSEPEDAEDEKPKDGDKDSKEEPLDE